MKYAFLAAIFSMCTWETTKDTTIEGSAEWPRQPIMEGAILCIREKNLQNRYQNTFFREKIKPFKRVIIVEMMYSESKLQR